MRLVIPILVILALVGALVAVKASQIGLLIQTGEAAQKAGPPPETVSSAQARKDSWRTTLFAVGSVQAGRGVTISNDSSGLVTRIHFESGDEVKAGAPLVELETSVERAQLASTTARLELAKLTLERTRALVAENVATQAELDSAASTLKSLIAEAGALRAQVERKVVRAPFAGKLGIREVNKGQYLSPGSPITTLQSVEEEYVDFSLPQEYLDHARVGLPVKLSAHEAGLELEGVVAAVDPSVSPTTRAFTLRASTKDPDQRLRPGMFLNVSLLLDQKRDVVIVPVTAVVYAPYGDSIFVIEAASKDKKGKIAKQQFVRVGDTRGDFVEVEKGLQGNETIVSAGAFKLRNGAPIKIDNSVGLEPKLTPKPENR